MGGGSELSDQLLDPDVPTLASLDKLKVSPKGLPFVMNHPFPLDTPWVVRLGLSSEMTPLPGPVSPCEHRCPGGEFPASGEDPRANMGGPGVSKWEGQNTTRCIRFGEVKTLTNLSCFCFFLCSWKPNKMHMSTVVTRGDWVTSDL